MQHFTSHKGCLGSVVRNKNEKTSPKPNPVYMYFQVVKLCPHWKDYFKF